MKTKTTRSAILFVLSFLLLSCGGSKESTKSSGKTPVLLDQNTFKVDTYSDDPTYGYTEKNPIKVGGVKNSEGPLNERRFLNALMGPNGEAITYSRTGSCCPFKRKNGFGYGGLLDMYRIAHKGLEKEIVLYINMYDADELKIPVGFKKKE